MKELIKKNENVKIFENENFGKVRVVLKDGEPRFVGRDVCDVVEIKNVSQALNSLDVDEKLIYTLHISGQNRDVWTINESGLYSLILRSKKPEAKKFKKWVTSEVLPSIRKHGVYSESYE